MPAKTPSNVIVNRSWPSDCVTIASSVFGCRIGNPLSILFRAAANNPRRRLRFGCATHDHVAKGEIALRPRPIKLDVVRFGELLRTHVAHYADHFRRKTVTVFRAEKNLAANRIFIREKFFCRRVAQNHHERRVQFVLLSEIATGQERDPEGAKISGRNASCQPKLPLVDRDWVPVRARVRRSRRISGERNSIRDGSGFDSGRGLQFGLQALDETSPRSRIRISRGRQSDASRPDALGAETGFLPAEPDKTGNQHRGSGQEHDR